MRRTRPLRAVSMVVVAAVLAMVLPAAADDSAPLQRVEAEVEVPSLTTPEARVVLARFTTSFAHDTAHKARASNVELAAKAINGRTIAAGGTFSFNDAVGERTAAFGYAKSVVLRDGMLAEGSGGGACQVASTLHAAALLSGLDILARAPHSRPSAYIRMGLDATVAMGGGSAPIDLKLKNPSPLPLLIHARTARGSLEVWIDTAAGSSRPTVTLTSEIVERMPFPRVVQRSRRAKADVITVKAFGIPGFRIKRTREIRSPDGTVKRDTRVDFYPPIHETIEVAPAFELDRHVEESRDEVGDTSGPIPRVAATGVTRPDLVQLRPSTTVVIDNSAQ